MTLCDDRRQWEEEALAVPSPKGIDFASESIAGVECVWVTDRNNTANKIILYLHGGGLVAGSAVTHKNLAANMAIASGLSVLLVNYRLLPENQYPAPLDDLLLVYNTLLTDYPYTSEQIVFGGDSSGSGLALAALVKLREANISLPKCAFMVSGAFDMTLSSESMHSNESKEPHMSKEALKKWQQDYLHFDLESPILSPIYADLSKLPPLLLLAGGLDPWLCDSRNVARKVQETGGEAKLRVWNSMGHVWIIDSELNDSQEAIKEIADFIQKES